jgi:hypothetical protein
MNKFIKICIFLWFICLALVLIKSNREIKNDTTDQTIIDKINKNQSQIENLTCQISSGWPLATNGLLAYEKEYNFRFMLNVKGVRKLDLGSNKDLLWFLYEPFSKKIHHWKRENLCDTIHEFNPEFIKEIFFYKISNDSIFFKSKQNCKIINLIKINGYLIKKIIIVKNDQISEYLFFNQEDEMEIKCEIIENQNIENVEFPKKIKLISKKLGSFIEIEIKDMKINQIIDKKMWNMPNLPSVEISK